MTVCIAKFFAVREIGSEKFPPLLRTLLAWEHSLPVTPVTCLGTTLLPIHITLATQINWPLDGGSGKTGNIVARKRCLASWALTRIAGPAHRLLQAQGPPAQLPLAAMPHPFGMV